MKKKLEFNESDYYLHDNQKEVINYYENYYAFYNDDLYGGETIFSLNTILCEVCRLLDECVSIKELICLEKTPTVKELNLSYIVLESFPLPGFSDKNYSDLNKVLGKISSKRAARFIVIMNSNQIPDEFKKLLIYYVFTIRKLGNYMPLLKLRMNGKLTGNSNTINQRKGNFYSYKDDPIKFYSALIAYINDVKNREFKNMFCDKYNRNNKQLEDFFELNYLNGLIPYLNQEDKYLTALLKNGLDGLYEYMWRACQIINDRHDLIFKASNCPKESNLKN